MNKRIHLFTILYPSPTQALPKLKGMATIKLNFYVLLYCALGMVVYSLVAGLPLTLPRGAVSWFYVGWLAVVPGIFALVLMVYAAKYVGSTATAILGALEPLTAVLIGLLVFNEPFTAFLAIGIVLILAAVVIIAMAQQKKQTGTLT